MNQTITYFFRLALIGCLLLGRLCPSARAQSPGRIPLSEAIATVEKRFNTKFAFEHNLLNGKYTTADALKGSSVESVLKNILYPNNVLFLYVSDNSYSLVGRNARFFNAPTPTGATAPGSAPAPVASADEAPAGASPQPRPLRGVVNDQDGKPLAFVNVHIKGTNRGTQTGERGEFILTNVNPTETLVFSYIGYQTQEVVVGNRSNLAITQAEDAGRTLDEVAVVSTGYQTISKERATGAFDVVGQKTLVRRPAADLSTALQGLVPGMQGSENADGSAVFRIRGNSSLYANGNPLIVVDGFPISQSSFSTINPNDVQSVTVLKDAAAASIWGARSANGVIVITTKRGLAKKGLSIEGSVFTRIGDRLNLDQILTQANSADQVAYEKLAWANNWAFQPYAGSFSDIAKPLTLAQELLYANQAGKLSEADLNMGLTRLSNTSNRQQIQDNLLQRPVLTQYNLNLQTATDRSKTMLSMLFEQNKTAFQKSGYNRYLLNVNNQYDATRFLTVTVGANIQYRDQNNSGTSLGEIQGLSPYELLINADGSYGANLAGWNREQQGLLPLKSFPYPDWSYNLLREVRGRQLTSTDFSLRLQGGLNFKIATGLTFDSKIQYERQQINRELYYNEDTYFVRNTVNNLVEYTPTTSAVGRAFIPKGGILAYPDPAVAPGRSSLNSYVFRNQLNFSKTIANQHELTAIVGSEISQYRTDSQTPPWSYGYNPDKLLSSVPQYGYGTSVDPFRDFQGVNASIPGSSTTYGYGLSRYVSFYGNLAYTYQGKYTLTGSARSDASNFITTNQDLRWAPLWSVGGLWNLKQEKFLQPVRFLDRLSLRLTHGSNGNVERSTSTETLLNIGTSVNTVTGTLTGTISSYGNPTLRWEKTSTTDLGIDFGLFGDKLFGKIDLYDKQGKDIVGLVALPAATGTASQRFNNSSISNRGIEIELGTRVGLGRTGVHYTTSLTYAYNRNRVTNLYYPGLLAYQLIDDPSTPTFVEGRPIGPVYSFDYLGMTNGVPFVRGPSDTRVSINSSALVNTGAGLQFMNYQGTSISPHTLGWYSTFAYNRFSLSVLLLGKFGGVYRNPTFNYSATVGSDKTFVNRFVKDVLAGDPTIPGFANKNETQTYLWDRYAPYLSSLVESSSYVQCKEITLDYQLPVQRMGKLNLQTLRVYAQVRDLAPVWVANSKGYFPEWLPGTLRPVPTYTLGLNFNY